MFLDVEAGQSRAKKSKPRHEERADDGRRAKAGEMTHGCLRFRRDGSWLRCIRWIGFVHKQNSPCCVSEHFLPAVRGNTLRDVARVNRSAVPSNKMQREKRVARVSCAEKQMVYNEKQWALAVCAGRSVWQNPPMPIGDFLGAFSSLTFLWEFNNLARLQKWDL